MPTQVLRASRILLIITLAAITWFSLTPTAPSAPDGADKLRHVVAYALTAVLLVLSIRDLPSRPRRVVIFVAAIIAYGIVIEFLQNFTGRHYDVMDMVANAVGAVAGAIVGIALHRVISRSPAVDTAAVNTQIGFESAQEKRPHMGTPLTIMPCLDMRDGRVVKGVRFVDIKDAGDPVECARAYCDAGAGALALLDITATVEGRPTMLDVVRRVAAVTTVPFTVGGGIGDVQTAKAVIDAGANTVSTSSAAFRRPELIRQLVETLGPECVTVAIDVDVNPDLPSGYEVYVDGGRTATGVDAVEWAKQVDAFGVPVILPTSRAADGERTGYDLPLIRALSQSVSARIVASGGAGTMEHFREAAEAGASILLAASVFHYHLIDIAELADYLRASGYEVR